MAILYLETNFLMSIATGRDPGAGDLLKLPQGVVDLAMPAVCFIEAYGSLARELKDRRNFQTQIKAHSDDKYGRDRLSRTASLISHHLTQARLEMDSQLNEMEARFDAAVFALADRAELIQLTRPMLALSVDGAYIEEPKDNLILNCIVEHARGRPDAAKGFLSGNTRDFAASGILDVLRSVGIASYFPNATNCLGWIRSLPTEPGE